MKRILRLAWLGLVAVVCALTGATARAEVKLAGVFQDHMVLQRDMSVPVWGWAAAGEAVTVTLGEQSRQATADDNGRWLVRFDALPAGGPLNLSAKASNEIQLQDVLVGEVWLCSGQSNMAMLVSRSLNFEQEQQQADLPRIRQFKTAAHATPEPQADCGGAWSVCGPNTVGAFSATAYFFGRKLHEELDVPIGLINSSWGGTDIAAWTSLPAQQAVEAIGPELQAYEQTITEYNAEKAQQGYEAELAAWPQRVEEAKAKGRPAPRRPARPTDPRVHQNRPANLYNGMIHPLVPYAIRGAIWYQGERNARSLDSGRLYAQQLPALIRDWRTRWEQGDFPFLVVQLPNFQQPQQAPVETSGWVLVREAEGKALRLPNTGLAVTTDVGEAADIHPRNKQAVGQRLALWALGTTYGRDIAYSGPLYAFSQYRTGRKLDNGKTRPGIMVVSFLHADGLKTRDGEPLRGFAVADEDRRFHAADAVLDESGTVTLSSPHVLTPVAARYNWAANPHGNLVNAAELPAAPFRTDAWEE